MEKKNNRQEGISTRLLCMVMCGSSSLEQIVMPCSIVMHFCLFPSELSRQTESHKRISLFLNLDMCCLVVDVVVVVVVVILGQRCEDEQLRRRQRRKRFYTLNEADKLWRIIWWWCDAHMCISPCSCSSCYSSRTGRATFHPKEFAYTSARVHFERARDDVTSISRRTFPAVEDSMHRYGYRTGLLHLFCSFDFFADTRRGGGGRDF